MNERDQDEKFDDVGPKITHAKELKAAITLKNIIKYGIALLLTLSITSDINLTNWLASRYFVMRIQAKLRMQHLTAYSQMLQPIQAGSLQGYRQTKIRLHCV